MISEVLLLLVFNSLFIQGLYRSSTFEWKSNFMYKPNKKNMSTANIDKQYNMILWFVRYYSLKYIGEKWSKPIITCPTCMASLHSSYFYFGYMLLLSHHLLSIKLIAVYIIYVFCLAGLNTLLTSLIDKD